MAVPFVKVAEVSELPPGTGKLVTGPFDKPMALFNVDGEFYAINQICPHRGGPLAQGKLTGCVVTCPWHGWTFDVRTGLPDHPGGHSVAAYQVKVEGAAVYVGWLKPAR
jgi:nitrite reductase/ring-hydroxylating ferredoxin subunit